VPKVWADTIDQHRVAVREAILDATGELVEARGLLGLSMSDIATTSGIARATLYRYFPTVDDVVAAWHERLVSHHLAHLRAVSEQHRDPMDKVRSVFTAYAAMRSTSATHGTSAALHGSDHVAAAHDAVQALVTDLLVEAAAAGAARDDMPPRELAAFCVHALGAAADLGSERAVGRLTSLVRETVQSR
jgi:AcrR family transcriptional regulator